MNIACKCMLTRIDGVIQDMGFVVFNGGILLAIMLVLIWLKKRDLSFSSRVFIAMVAGLALGSAMQWIYGAGAEIIKDSISYFNIIGHGYVALLKMTIMPLIMISIIAALLKMRGQASLGKLSGITLGLLLTTTAISAAIAIVVSLGFNLKADGLLLIDAATQPGERLIQRLDVLADYSIPQMLVDFIPANPFLDMAGGRPTSTIAVVIFSVFLGLSGLAAIQKQPELENALIRGVEVIQAVITSMVRLVLGLTPYGVLALMTKMAATSQMKEIMTLLEFILANYTALGLVFAVHLGILLFFKITPAQFISKAGPTLAFAFTSRSSAGAIPMNIDTQVKKFGVSEGIANFSASLGATIGQNGCAGVYPAILAVMVAPLVGINPLDYGFIATLIMVITVSSFGVAGVGGGATFAALMVLSTMNLPVALVGLLVAVEPLIDMGRTALNVSGSMMAGIVTHKVLDSDQMVRKGVTV